MTNILVSNPGALLLPVPIPGKPLGDGGDFANFLNHPPGKAPLTPIVASPGTPIPPSSHTPSPRGKVSISPIVAFPETLIPPVGNQIPPPSGIASITPIVASPEPSISEGDPTTSSGVPHPVHIAGSVEARSSANPETPLLQATLDVGARESPALPQRGAKTSLGVFDLVIVTDQAVPPVGTGVPDPVIANVRATITLAPSVIDEGITPANSPLPHPLPSSRPLLAIELEANAFAAPVAQPLRTDETSVLVTAGVAPTTAGEAQPTSAPAASILPMPAPAKDELGLLTAGHAAAPVVSVPTPAAAQIDRSPSIASVIPPATSPRSVLANSTLTTTSEPLGAPGGEFDAMIAEIPANLPTALSPGELTWSRVYPEHLAVNGYLSIIDICTRAEVSSVEMPALRAEDKAPPHFDELTTAFVPTILSEASADQKVVAAANTSHAESSATIATDKFVESLSRSLGSALAADHAWPERLIRLSRNSEGVSTLWLRDFTLRESDVDPVVMAIKRHAYDAGVAIGRVMVNGREAWRASNTTLIRGE